MSDRKILAWFSNKDIIYILKGINTWTMEVEGPFI